MALYLGKHKIAGGGSGSGNANIVSCDNYDDYVAKRDANLDKGITKVSYYTPDEGGGGSSFQPTPEQLETINSGLVAADKTKLLNIKVDGIEVVNELPPNPDPNTLYFITES